jgi:Antibiotic biosynthesis monooxygenase
MPGRDTRRAEWRKVLNIRLVQFSLGTGMRPAAEAIADKVVPAIRAQPGCMRCEFITDDDTGDYGIVVLWASKQAADASYTVISPILMPALAIARGAPSIRLYDVYEPKK